MLTPQPPGADGARRPSLSALPRPQVANVVLKTPQRKLEDAPAFNGSAVAGSDAAQRCAGGAAGAGGTGRAAGAATGTRPAAGARAGSAAARSAARPPQPFA